MMCWVVMMYWMENWRKDYGRAGNKNDQQPKH